MTVICFKCLTNCNCWILNFAFPSASFYTMHGRDNCLLCWAIQKCTPGGTWVCMAIQWSITFFKLTVTNRTQVGLFVLLAITGFRQATELLLTYFRISVHIDFSCEHLNQWMKVDGPNYLDVNFYLIAWLISGIFLMSGSFLLWKYMIEQVHQWTSLVQVAILCGWILSILCSLLMTSSL